MTATNFDNFLSNGKMAGSSSIWFHSLLVQGKNDERKVWLLQWGSKKTRIVPPGAWGWLSQEQVPVNVDQAAADPVQHGQWILLLSAFKCWPMKVSYSRGDMLDLQWKVLVTKRALLCCTCSSFLMFRWVWGSKAAVPYSTMGLTYVL